MRKLLIGVIILAVLLVVADRISVAVAENQISDRLTSAYGLAGKPGVTITGFPFLTQVVTGDYQQIDVSASQVPAGGAVLHHLNVRLTGVHATVSQVLGNGSSMVTADRAAGSAMVGFGTVDHRLPGGFRLHPDGKNLSVSGRLADRRRPHPGVRHRRPGRVRLRHQRDAGARQRPGRRRPALPPPTPRSCTSWFR